MTYINRDPFARTELHRETEYVGANRTCDWCGNAAVTKLGNYLYRYRTESDGGRSSEHRGLFCCKSCHDAYHGG
jgi:hypothetical protein